VANTHYEGKKYPLYVVTFCKYGHEKSVKFFDSSKAGGFYSKLKADHKVTRLKKKKYLISPEQKRQELAALKQLRSGKYFGKGVVKSEF